MGGMMSFILDSLNFLKDDFDITLWGVTSDNSILNEIKNEGNLYKVRSFSNVKTKNKVIPNLFKVIYGIWKFKKAIIRENYDVLYIHGIPLAFPFFSNKVKVVNHIHGLNNPYTLSSNVFINNYLMIKAYDLYRSRVIRKSDLILLAADNEGGDLFVSNFPKDIYKIKQIPNFADSSIFKVLNKNETRKSLEGIGEKEYVIVNTGRICYGKDQVLLVKSFAYLINTLNINAKLVVIGDGDIEIFNEVNNIIINEKIESSVILTGKLDRKTINLWLNASDLYVFTSMAEGYPISLAESAMCGLPIVTTDVTGVHDLVINNYSGLLVKERKPKEIAKSIKIALKNKNEFSKNILKISKKYSPEVILNKVKENINSII